MEAILLATDMPIEREKIEMDGSYKKVANESGIFSNDSNNSTGSSAWDFWKDEIADPEIFDPPILQSTNLMENDKAISCNWSSITGASASGNIAKFPEERLK